MSNLKIELFNSPQSNPNSINCLGQLQTRKAKERPKSGKTLAGKGRSQFDFVLPLIGLEIEIRAPNKVLFHCIDNYRISFNGPFSNSPQLLFQSQSKCNDLGHSFRVEIKFSGSIRF